MPNLTRIFLRGGASAASLGAYALNKTAEAMRALAHDGSSRSHGTDVPVEHRGEARRVEPPQAAPRTPSRTPSNPAAPAGGDPDGSSGTGPVPRRISNPKAARKARKRAAPASSVKRLEVKGSAKGAKPSTAAKPEPTPVELAKAGAGRQPAPMGSSDD